MIALQPGEVVSVLMMQAETVRAVERCLGVSARVTKLGGVPIIVNRFVPANAIVVCGRSTDDDPDLRHRPLQIVKLAEAR